MYWTYLKTFTFLFILAAIFGGGYVLFRTHQSSETALLKYMSAQQSAPPTRCTFSGGGFNAALQGGVIYMDGPNLRADWIQFEYGRSDNIHDISNDNGLHFYIWGDGPGTPYIFTKEQTMAGNDFSALLSDTGHCSPWWSPDTSIFVIPEDITFTPYNG